MSDSEFKNKLKKDKEYDDIKTLYSSSKNVKKDVTNMYKQDYVQSKIFADDWKSIKGTLLNKKLGDLKSNKDYRKLINNMLNEQNDTYQERFDKMMKNIKK